MSFSYDGLGDRTARTVDDVSEFHVLDRGAALHNVLMVTDEAGTPLRYYIWGRGLIAHVDADGTIRHYHADGQGSTLALTDENGQITDEWFWSPYGELMARTGGTRPHAAPYGAPGSIHRNHCMARVDRRHSDAAPYGARGRHPHPDAAPHGARGYSHPDTAPHGAHGWPPPPRSTPTPRRYWCANGTQASWLGT